jgi:hypothetical protein
MHAVFISNILLKSCTPLYAGLLLAAGALQADASAPVMHLRSMNPYVTAALQVSSELMAGHRCYRCLQHVTNKTSCNCKKCRNLLVCVASQDWHKSAGLAARIPLQQGAGMFTAGGSGLDNAAAVGTSSFGMSGVNAHALLSRPEGTVEAAAQQQQVTSCSHLPIPRS